MWDNGVVEKTCSDHSMSSDTWRLMPHSILESLGWHLEGKATSAFPLKIDLLSPFPLIIGHGEKLMVVLPS